MVDLLLGLCTNFVLVAVNKDELVGSAVDGAVKFRLAVVKEARSVHIRVAAIRTQRMRRIYLFNAV